jgi:hypothetical protein
VPLIDGLYFTKRFQLRKLDWKTTKIYLIATTAQKINKPIHKLLQSEFPDMYTDAELEYHISVLN